MKKRLIMLLGSALAVSAVGVGSTLALFTDSATKATEFTAGSLCLDADRNAGDSAPGPMFYMTGYQGRTSGGDLGEYPTDVPAVPVPIYQGITPGGWTPGDAVTRTLDVFNGDPGSGCARSMKAKITGFSASWGTHKDGHVTTLEDFKDVLYVTVTGPQPGGSTPVVFAQGFLRDFMGPEGKPTLVPYQLAAWNGATSRPHVQLQFEVKLIEGAGDEFQGGTAVVDFTVHAAQARNN